jgi:hypothetical protein
MNPASRSVATDRPSPSATARSNRFGDLALGSALLWLCPLCSASNGGRSLLSGLSRVRRKGGTRSQPDSGPCPLWPHRPPALSQGNSSRGAEDGRGAPASAFGQAGMEVVLLRGRGTREGRDPRRGWDWDRSNFVPLCPSVLGRWSWQRVGQARVPPRLLKQRLFTPFTILHSTYYSILFQPRQEGIENSRTRHRFHDRCDGDGGIGLRADDDAPTDDSVPGTVGLPLQLHRTQRRIEFTARGLLRSLAAHHVRALATPQMALSRSPQMHDGAAVAAACCNWPACLLLSMLCLQFPPKTKLLPD